MGRPDRLTPEAVQEALADLGDWTSEAGRLQAHFDFPGFAEAIGFMAAAAVVAAELDHHPDWSNSYRRVSVELSTHDAGGVTELDLRLATRMSEIAAALRA
jgi:4a-hydroxytetrahydrobiopterin dehydratase